MCDKCEFRSDNVDQLQKHLDSCHTILLSSALHEKCNSCELRFKDKQELNVHILNSHEKTVFRCTLCDFETISNDEIQLHKKIKHKDEVEIDSTEVSKLKELNNLLSAKNIELENKLAAEYVKNDEACKLFEKLKKEKVKLEKDMNQKVSELKDQLEKSYQDVKRFCDEITILKDEKKALMNIHKVNSELHEELKNRKELSSNVSDCAALVDPENVVHTENDEITVTDMAEKGEVVTVDDEEVSEGGRDAYSATEVIDKSWACSLCEFKTKSESHIRNHLKAHENPCNRCGKNFKSKDYLEKHMIDSHEKNNTHEKSRQKSGGVCRFWLKGICNRGNDCRFEHKRSDDEISHKTKKCRFQDKCRYGVRCNFVHENIKPCLYQERCRNERCIYYHFDNQKPFLAKPNLKSVRDFPPLRSHRVPVWV